MRILLLNWQDRLNPQAGGAEAHLHEIFGRLVSRGHSATMLVSGWPSSARRETVDGIDVHRTGGRHTFSIAAPRYYRRELKDETFDVVVEALNKVPLFSPLWAAAPVVLLVHHLFGTTAFREASAPVAALTWLLERPLPLVYRGVATEVISRSTAEDLASRGFRSRDVRVIHPGVDRAFFTPGDDTDRVDEPTFLYLGRLRRYKGVDLLVRAIARLRAEGVFARLLIAGRGEWGANLQALAQTLGVGDRVRFLGFVTEEQKRDLLRRSWANVFPSPKEGWGITSIEAAACGTPTIASDSPGLRESVADGVSGLLVPHGDLDALTGAMRRLATDRALVADLGRRAAAFAAPFTWDRAADETERHLLEIVSSRSHPIAGSTG